MTQFFSPSPPPAGLILWEPSRCDQQEVRPWETPAEPQLFLAFSFGPQLLPLPDWLSEPRPKQSPSQLYCWPPQADPRSRQRGATRHVWLPSSQPLLQPCQATACSALFCRRWASQKLACSRRFSAESRSCWPWPAPSQVLPPGISSRDHSCDGHGWGSLANIAGWGLGDTIHGQS